ncbi:MAG TPA: EamA family transporter [Xanthobacteraceae bacterium]|nr:EamA family transporter [Xanthobacteraceae bacterium]
MTHTAVGILLVVLSSLIEGLGEISFKKSRLQRQRQVFWVLLGVAIFVVQMSVYTAALRFLAVGAAFAMASLSFVFVALLSKYLLREAVTPVKWLGIALIMAGTSLIGAYA